MASVHIEDTAATAAKNKSKPKTRLAPNYWPFVIPALVVIAAVIVFPWVFTLWMSVNSWTLGQSQTFAGFANYVRLATDARFWEALWHTVLYTGLSVIVPVFWAHLPP